MGSEMETPTVPSVVVPWDEAADGVATEPRTTPLNPTKVASEAASYSRMPVVPIKGTAITTMAVAVALAEDVTDVL